MNYPKIYLSTNKGVYMSTKEWGKKRNKNKTKPKEPGIVFNVPAQH